MNVGQRITSPEGPGEVLTIFDDKVIVKLYNGQTTTLQISQVEAFENSMSTQTILTGESPLAAEARAQHAGQIVERLDHADDQSQSNTNYQKEEQTMEMSEDATDVINDLIEINNDRIVGFERASADLEEEDGGLRTVFAKLADDSRQHVADLTEFAQANGIAPVAGGSTSGALHRTWLDVKAVFTGGDLEAILNECERGEDAILGAYETALTDDNDLSPELVSLLQQQQRVVNEGHDLVKSLRDQVEADNEADDRIDEELQEGTIEGTYDGEPSVNSNEPYRDAAGEYQNQNVYGAEPESTEQEAAWQDLQDTSAGNSKLSEFFIDQLKDLLWAERELVDTLPDMAEAATSEALRDAFNNHMLETAGHVTRLEEIFAILGLEPEANKCDAMAGIVDEGDTIISITEEGTAQRDVGLIFAGQKAEHYEIASYGGMIALAKTLGYYEIAEMLVLTLDEEKTADALLTEIAEGSANYQASKEPADE
ncbi:MAG: DUF892 family protein [Bacteroidota bacterium]